MKNQNGIRKSWLLMAALALISAAAMTCAQDNNPPEGLAETPGGAGPVIKFDLDARPFPEIPFPNDLAARVDKSSPTGLRLNVSLNAPTELERDLRAKIDTLTGFGTFGSVTISFDRPIDINIIIQRHQQNDDFNDDAVLLINMNPRSPNYAKAVPLDMGKGNFPLQLERNDNYFSYDPRVNASNLFLETYDEDANGNHLFDPGIDIDTDFDGIFDRPNVFSNGAWGPNAGDAWSSYHDLVDFYERETNTLIMRPVLPLEEESEYAVVVTNRLKGLPYAAGVAWPVRSPFAYVNHTQQTEALRPLIGILPRYGLSISDVAFTWKFTTGSMTRDMVAIRRGLYRRGPMAYLGARFPDKVNNLIALPLNDVGNPYEVKSADFIGMLQLLLTTGLGDILGLSAGDIEPLIQSYDYVDYFVFGDFKSPNFLIDRDGIANPLHPADDNEIFQVNPLTGAAVVGDATVPFLCSVPKPNYRMDQIRNNTLSGGLDPVQIETHVNHRVGKVATDSTAGRIDRSYVLLDFDTMARRYELTFTGATTFDAWNLDGDTTAGAGSTGADFTTDDVWLTVQAAAWSGTFAADDKAAIDIETYMDPINGPFTQTYTVTFTSGSAFDVTDGLGADQGSGTTGGDFPTDDGWLTIYSSAWGGSFAAGETFEIDTVAMGPPFPTVIEGHGYGSMKFEMLGFAGNLAKHGLAVCDADAVGHGIGLPPDVQVVIDGLKLKLCNPPADDDIAKLCEMIDPILALLKGRARDLNNDGEADSGGDFWSADTFHTRDIVRQSIIDQIQMIRVFRAFDGTNTWTYDMNGDGIEDDLAGDFNGDGVTDFGGRTGDFHTWGISLGGILSGILAGIEPAITSAAPVSGGAGLIDIAARSTQGGVVEAVFLRLFGPILLGVPSAGQVKLQWMIPNVNSKGYVDIGLTDQVAPGDKVTLKNLKTGEERWAIAAANKSFRIHIPADAADAVEKRIILGWGPDYAPGDTTGCRPQCDVPDPLKLGDPIQITVYNGALGEVKQVINTWLQDSVWQGSWFVAGTPLTAPAEGLGHYRNTPDFRRFLGIAQSIMDPADPGTYAMRYFMPADPANAPNSYYTPLGPLDFTDIDPDIQMGANVLVIPTIGDTNVPQNTAIAEARNAGLIELFAKDPIYGKTHNQVLLDNFVVEGVEKIEPYTVSKNGSPYHILFDLDDLDEGGACDAAVYHFCKSSPSQDYICTDNDSTDPAHACADGYNAPTLDPPLRLTLETTNGVAGMRMPYMQPTGQHGFDVPHPNKAFNIELYNINMIGRYFQTNGGQILNDTCLENDSCAHIPPPPQ
ncbi:MAG TPA: hypothetical protein VM658_13940 [bacterium]|nr:hypothetical protein [bacterium]